MFKTKKDFEKAMYNILIQIRDNGVDSIESKFGDIDFDDAISTCVYNGLIKGLSIQGESGNLQASIIGKVRLSLEGLSFIEDFESNH